MKDCVHPTDPRMNEAAWRALDLVRTYAARDRAGFVEHLAHLEVDQLEHTGGVLITMYIDTLAASGEKALQAIRAARAEVRRQVWRLAGREAPDAGGMVTVDLDGVLVIAHSDKEDAAPTWKRTYGHHPLMGFVDHGPGGTGEPVAALLAVAVSDSPRSRRLTAKKPSNIALTAYEFRNEPNRECPISVPVISGMRSEGANVPNKDMAHYLKLPWKSSLEMAWQCIGELPWATVAEILGKSGLEGAPHAIQAGGILTENNLVYAIGVGVNGDVGAKAALEEIVRWRQGRGDPDLNLYKVGAGLANIAGLGAYAASGVGAVSPAMGGAGAQIAGMAYLVIEGSSKDPARATLSLARRAMDAGREGYSYIVQGYGTGILSKEVYAAGLGLNGLVGAQAFSDEFGNLVRTFKRPDEKLPKPNYGKMLGGILNMAGAVGYAIGSSNVLHGVFPHSHIQLVRGISAAAEAVSYGVIIGSEVSARVATEREVRIPLLPTHQDAAVSHQSDHSMLPAIAPGPSLSNMTADILNRRPSGPDPGRTGPVPPVDTRIVSALTPTREPSASPSASPTGPTQKGPSAPQPPHNVHKR
ncbi:hypothetical protein RKD37_002821 [Streptomyces ambofaciens]